MTRARIVIAGTHSGVGKTTITLGIMAALHRRGLEVQGFKVGPDYIDPSYHTAVTRRPSRNLDTWMLGQDVTREVFHRGSERADISVIEGVMGMNDGKDPLADTGSTAEVSEVLDAPVILVVDVSSMARSAAAIVLGFQQLNQNVRIAGFIANRVGSKGHYDLVKAAVEQVCEIPAVGYLTTQEQLRIPERHLGLIPALERGEMDELFSELADAIEATVDVGKMAEIARRANSWTAPQPSLFTGQKRQPIVTIGVARDQAFNFYYPENLELLEWHGARLVEFSPLDNEAVPDEANGVYIGGGFPEEFAAQLSQCKIVRASLKGAIQRGMPTLAECGGFMYLTEELHDRQGDTHKMTGIVLSTVTMQPHLTAIGYQEVTAKRDTLVLHTGERARGHVFHYSNMDHAGDSWPYAFEISSMRGSSLEGFAKGNVLAGYTHLHFASNPRMAMRFVEACELYSRAGASEAGGRVGG